MGLGMDSFTAACRTDPRILLGPLSRLVMVGKMGYGYSFDGVKCGIVAGV